MAGKIQAEGDRVDTALAKRNSMLRNYFLLVSGNTVEKAWKFSLGGIAGDCEEERLEFAMRAQPELTRQRSFSPMSTQSSTAHYIRRGLLILGGAAIAVGIAFYQERIFSFLSQEGWNPNAATGIITRFVKEAHEPTGGAAATALLDPVEYGTTVKDGRLVTVNRGKGMARASAPVKDVAPTPTLKQAKAELLAMDGGSYRVVVQYANGKWGEYRVRRRNGARKIAVTPTLLFDTPPPRSPSDY